MRAIRWTALALLSALWIGLPSAPTLAVAVGAAAGGPPPLPHPILYVTQFPIPYDFAARASVFGNHRGSVDGVGRGGDLWILYPDGSRRNLTQLAGYGVASGFQGADSIAVREPCVHWDATRAVFSMVVGAPPQQFVHTDEKWQLYEVTGLGPSDTPVVTAVPNQPADYNNVSPVYAADDRIVFTSDYPRDGAEHLHPLLDEYEEVPTVTGLYSLDPASGDLRLLDFAPSGDFTPLVDSFGRVVFSRWDHLQRDQQADADALAGTPIYGTFNYASEAADAELLEDRTEVFPEPRPARTDLLAGTNLEGHRFNHFFPWMVNPDGSELETLNHVGRHELHGYFNRSINDDPNVVEFIAAASGRINPNPIENLLQIAEDPNQPGRYVGVDAPEFQTQGAGMVVAIDLPPGTAPDLPVVAYLTHPDTRDVTAPGEPAPPNHSGHYRDPLVLADGRIVAAHTAETGAAGNAGTRPAPDSIYDYRLRLLGPVGGYLAAAADLTPGTVKTVSYWDPDVLVEYSGPFWEIEPVEVRPRARPPIPSAELAPPEAQIFSQEAVDPEALRLFLRDRDLALIVSRDVTTRDALDAQQPFNLQVPGGVATQGAPGTIYDVSHLQLFQADQIRGLGGTADPPAGRRVLAQVMHEPRAVNPPNPTGPQGSVAVAPDGSLAAFVPALRPMAWQLTEANGTPVVRERYWLTFQPGEIRVCGSCHGLSSQDQAGGTAPTNPPQALATLLSYWKTELAPLFADGFETGDLTAWSAAVP